MSFTVRMGTDLVAVEAGATVPLTFEIANRTDEQDRFEVSVEGLDPEWVAVPVPTFPVEARDIREEKVFLKPPRVSESLAGDYPFVLKVRSLSDGESRNAQGVLSIKPYHHLGIEIQPKKGVISPLRKENAFQATLINLGNTPHTVQLFANDPDDELTYSFSEDLVTLGPGQTKVVEVVPKPVKSRAFSGARLYGFTVGARSTSVPSVACSAQAQLEVRPLMSPGLIAVFLLAAVLFFGWLRLLPKPPSIDSLSLDKNAPVQGETLRVTWQASNATSVRIRVNGVTLVEGQELEGSKEFIAVESGTVEAVAFRDGKASTPVTRTFTVTVPPEFPQPRIEAFDIQPRTLKLGQPFLVKYKVNDAVVHLILTPTGDQLDPKLDQKTLTANLVGEITYELIAENAAKPPQIARKSITVTVVEASKAAIIVFKAEPNALPEFGGEVKVTWHVSNAVRVELSDARQTQVLEGESGERTIFVDADTELTLSAYDDQGHIVTRKVKITVQKPPPPAETAGGTKQGRDSSSGAGGG